VIVYDTGALVAGERGTRELWALHDTVLREGRVPLVPAGVLAQAWRGGPQANLSRLLGGCTVVALDEQHARLAGTLCAKAATSDVVDASVVVLAHLVGGAVITSDATDVRRLIDAVGAPIAVHEV
jgi:hypothetical protein